MVTLVCSPMTIPSNTIPKTPYYLLFSEATSEAGKGQWRFVLRTPSGDGQIEVHDEEPDVHGERLELLTVVRGLEALEQPSRVTLVTTSMYVREGVRHGLSEWRNNGWKWERFGEMVPVKNCDLWLRIDRAMRYHQIDCRVWRFDPPHSLPIPTKLEAGSSTSEEAVSRPLPVGLQWGIARLTCLRRRVLALGRLWKRRIRNLSGSCCGRLSGRENRDAATGFRSGIKKYLQGGWRAHHGSSGQNWTTG